MCAALSRETAAWAGSWADGLLTTFQPGGKLEDIISAFRSSGGARKPIHVKLTFSYARDYETAKSEAYHQWRFNCIDNSRLAEIDSVQAFDRATENVPLENLLLSMPIEANIEIFIKLIEDINNMGVDHIVLHNVGRNQEEFIEDFAKNIIPHFS